MASGFDRHMERDIASRASKIDAIADSAAGRVGEPPLGTPSRWPAGRLRLRRLDAGHRPSFAEDVRQGLTSSPKVLQPRYFYDDLGSLLFATICALPEYYLTRAEAEILHAHAGEIVASLNGPVRLVELGSGDARKTRLLIDALLARQGRLDYMPIDVSASALEQGSEQLLSTYPNLRVTALVADYAEGLRSIRDQEPLRAGHARNTLVLFLGSTVGNLGPEDRVGLLREVRDVLRPGDALLLGTDLKKPESILIPAYDDPLGVTAAFNLNVLARINRELAGGFDLRQFRHLARWNAGKSRVEMHLESRRAQTVPIRSLDLEIPFEEGETIHTENSHKFTVEQVEALAAETGFKVTRVWQDSGRRFASSLLVAR